MHIFKRYCFERIFYRIHEHLCQNFLKVNEFSKSLPKCLYVHRNLNKVLNSIVPLFNFVWLNQRRQQPLPNLSFAKESLSLIDPLEETAFNSRLSINDTFRNFQVFNSLTVQNHVRHTFQIAGCIKLEVFKELQTLFLEHLNLQETHSVAKSEDGSHILLVPSHIEDSLMRWVYISLLFVLGVVQVLIDCVLAPLDRLRFVSWDHVEHWLHWKVLQDLLQFFIYLTAFIDYLHWPDLGDGRAQSHVEAVVVKRSQVTLKS
jgi:hypothetical protein